MPTTKRTRTDYRTLIVACLAAMAAPISGQALTEAGNGVIVLDVTGGMTYDSNIFTNDEELEDYLFTLNPTLRYQQERGAIHLSVGAGLNIGEFLDYSEQSYQDLSVDLSLSGFHREDSPFNFGLLAGWHEETRASEEVGTRIESEIAEAVATADLALSEKLGLRTGIDFQDSVYSNSFYKDSEDLEVRIDAVHYYSEKLHLTAGYRYRDISYSEDLPDQQTDSFIIGAEGQLSPKLTGIAEIGYILQDNDEDDTFIYTLALDWSVDEKTSVSLEGKRDTSTSLTGQNALSTNITLSIYQEFTEQLTARAFAGYGEFERSGLDSRDDDFVQLGAGLTKAFDETTSLTADLSYESRNSNSVDSDYDRIQASVRLNLLF